MKQLHTLRNLILLTAMATSASHAADPARVAPVLHSTGVIVLPQVVIIGKRLDPVEKNRLAQISKQERTATPSASTGHKS
jgi:hypothetical protein